jgi:hypothetical protein
MSGLRKSPRRHQRTSGRPAANGEFTLGGAVRAPWLVRPVVTAPPHWHFIYMHLGGDLYHGRINNCVLTLTEDPRVLGYFAPDAIEDRSGNLLHEIAINSEHASIVDELSVSTLRHEMEHADRHLYGPRGADGSYGPIGFHDEAWAAGMEARGLMPSDTGKPGGHRTGYSVGHYVIPGGAFERAWTSLGAILSTMGNAYEGCFETWADEFMSAVWRGDDEASAMRRFKSMRTRFSCTCGETDRRHPWTRPSCPHCLTPMTLG